MNENKVRQRDKRKAEEVRAERNLKKYPWLEERAVCGVDAEKGRVASP